MSRFLRRLSRATSSKLEKGPSSFGSRFGATRIRSRAVDARESSSRRCNAAGRRQAFELRKNREKTAAFGAPRVGAICKGAYERHCAATQLGTLFEYASGKREWSAMTLWPAMTLRCDINSRAALSTDRVTLLARLWRMHYETLNARPVGDSASLRRALEASF